MAKRKKRYYHMIIQRPGYVNWGTETYTTHISTRKRAPDGWVLVVVIGYHEEA